MGSHRRLRLLASWLVAACSGYGCGQDGAREPDAAADDHQAAWHAEEPERYVVQTCSLGIEPPGCIRAVIDGDEVTAAEERVFDPSVPWWEAVEVDQKPLDQMFERIHAGKQDDCSVDEVEYDEAFGYVQRYTLDCEGSVTGGRWVACFERDAQDLEACDVVP